MNVEFDNDYRVERRAMFEEKQERGFIGWLIKRGIVKNQSQANALLIFITIINFLLIIFILYYTI